MALDRQKEAAEKRSRQEQQQQKQAEGLVPRMKVTSHPFTYIEKGKCALSDQTRMSLQFLSKALLS